MTILFVHTEAPPTTLEDETFLALTTIYPKALTFKWRENTAQDFRSFLVQHRPSLIISSDASKSNLHSHPIISSVSSNHSLILRTNVFGSVSSPQRTKHPQYLLPPLKMICPAKPPATFFL